MAAPGKEARVTDRLPTDEDTSRMDQDSGASFAPDVSPLSVQEIGSASRSCLVIIVLVVVILLLICLSWLVRVVL